MPKTNLQNFDHILSLVRYLNGNQLSGVLPAGMCGRSYTYCTIDGGRFTTNCAGCGYSVPTTTSAVDTQALRDLFISTNGVNWNRNRNWNNGDPCTNGWAGVYCDTSLSVLSLDLTGNNVIGPMSTTIGNLKYLTKLALGGNGITGSIPPSLSSMIQLTNLALSNNRLNSTIPTLPNSLSYL